MYIVNYSLFSKADGKGVIFRLSFSGWTYRWYKIRLKQAVTFLGLRISLSSQEMRHPKDLEARLFVLVLSVHHLNQTLSCREAGFPKYFSLIEVVATEAILVHPPSSPQEIWLEMSSVKIVKECVSRENVLSLNYSNTKAFRFRRIIFSICLGNLIFNHQKIFEKAFSIRFVGSFSGLFGFLTTLSSRIQIYCFIKIKYHFLL